MHPWPATILAPHRILKPVLIPQAAAHCVRYGIQPYGMSGFLECKQVAIGARRSVEDHPRTAGVVDQVIHVT